MNVTTSASIPMANNFSEEGINTTWSQVRDGTDQAADPDAYLYDLGMGIFVIVDMILVLFGCVGNILTFLVCVRKRLRSSSVSIFIAALAIFDTLVLLLDWMNNWLEIQVNIQPLENFEFCVFHRWFFNVAYTTSAWLVAGVAVERLIAVWFPLTAKIWCTVKNSLIAVVSFPVIISLLYSYNFWMWQGAASGKCEVNPVHGFFMNDVSPWFTAVLYSYIPLIIIVTSNSVISIKLFTARQKRAAMTGDSPAKNDTRKVTVTVMAISAAFVCLTVPLTVWYIWVFAAQKFSNAGPRIFFIEIIILIVGLTNHAINFFLYVLTSERFRAELRDMFCLSSCSQSGQEKQAASGTSMARTKSTKLSASTGSSLQNFSVHVSDTPTV